MGLRVVPEPHRTNWTVKTATGKTMATNSDHATNQRPVVTPTEARSGVTGHNVRYVLLYGLVGVVVAFAVVYFVVFSQHG
jgi:hypothetical protein